jgi:two-component system OmpR family sensor kinase
VVRRVIFLALPLLLGLAGIGGYLLATHSLAPLNWMAEQAREITGSNLNRRLEIGRAAEELLVLAASFNELLARLDQSFEAMRRFVADASHELRTPIAVIRGEADVALSHDRGAAEYRESLAIVLDESRRLSRLVDDLLNLARADAGRVRLELQEFYFNDLLAECCRSMQTLAGASDITLECRAPGDVPQFRGDEALLRRLVINLLDNAIRYTPPGGKVSALLEADAAAVRISHLGYRSGHPPGSRAPRFRALLPGRQSALPPGRRLRPGPIDREVDRRSPPRHSGVCQPTRRRHHFHGNLAPLIHSRGSAASSGTLSHGTPEPFRVSARCPRICRAANVRERLSEFAEPRT